MRYTINDDASALIAAANLLQTNIEGMNKEEIVAHLNEEMDKIDMNAEYVTINLGEAKNALSEVEMVLLSNFLLKIHNSKMMNDLDEKLKEKNKEYAGYHPSFFLKI